MCLKYSADLKIVAFAFYVCDFCAERICKGGLFILTVVYFILFFG